MKPHYAAVRYPRTATSAEELDAMRRAAWQRQGLVVVDPAELGDDWLRAGLLAWATQQYGPRAPNGGAGSAALVSKSGVG